MDYAALALGQAIPWLLGIAVLHAADWPRGGFARPGQAALCTGYGYFAGALLLTLWMRALSRIGVPFSWLSIGGPLLAITVALVAYCAWRGRRFLAGTRAAITALVHPPVAGWQRVAWLGLIGWLALRFLLLAGEIAWRPLYPWDAWLHWATKARVWYELGRIVPFVSADVWLSGTPGVFFDANPNYPATVPLMQVWSSVALGRWDDSAMNWPWLLMLIALTLAIYGALRGEGVATLLALIGAYFMATLPMVDVHVALAGYADLPMAAVYTLAVLALYRWTQRRDFRDAGVALFFAICCPLIKTPGWIWLLTLAPAVVVALFPRRGMRIVGVCFALAILALLALARTTPTILGYQLHLEFAPAWRSLTETYFLFGNWNFLWYGLIALAAIGWRRLGEPPLASLAVVVAGGLGFLFVVFGFTNAVDWVVDYTTVNRATLHLAPLLVTLAVLLWHQITLQASTPSPTAAATNPL